MKIRSILFVCKGNICRSPLAEGIASRMNEENKWNLTISSCATSAYHVGNPPHDKSIKAAKLNGIDISHQRSRRINVYSDMEFDLIIAMDSENKRDILALGFDKEKVFKLGEFSNNEDVPDPYYENTDRAFLQVYELLEKLLKNMFISLGFLES